MKKLLIPTWLLIILIAAIIIYTKALSNKWPEICFDKTCFDVEIANTNEQRQKWLMFRQNMPEKSGMIFVFEKSQPYWFWMKNTLIPLDMLWIDDQLQIVDIQQATPCTQDPCPSYKPKWVALYVLELNKWISEKYEIKIWDKMNFKNILTK